MHLDWMTGSYNFAFILNLLTTLFTCIRRDVQTPVKYLFHFVTNATSQLMNGAPKVLKMCANLAVHSKLF